MLYDRIKQLESMLTTKDEAFMNLQTQFHENTTFYQKKIHELQEEIIRLKKQEDESQKVIVVIDDPLRLLSLITDNQLRK